MVSVTWAQLGINTPSPKSTLSVQGSFSGRYREVYISNYTVGEEDYTICYTGNSTESVFTLPTTKDINDSNTGRIYHIKNRSTVKNITVKTQPKQGFRFGGGNSAKDKLTEMTLLPGEYISIMSNFDGGWDVMIYDQERRVSKTTLWGNNIVNESEIKLGRFSVRAFNYSLTAGAPYANHPFLQYKYDSADASVLTTVWFSKVTTQRATVVNSLYRERQVTFGSWYCMYGDSVGSSYDYLNLIGKEMAVIYVTIENTGEMYRITALGIPEKTLYNTKSQITITLEKLN